MDVTKWHYWKANVQTQTQEMNRQDKQRQLETNWAWMFADWFGGLTFRYIVVIASVLESFHTV